MQATEELYDLQNDSLEMFNQITDPKVAADLDSLRQIYDREIAGLEKNSRSPYYAKYSTLFDRSSSWGIKRALLPKKLTPAGK